MCHRMLIILLPLALSTAARAQEVDRSKLRQLLRLPSMTVGYVIGFSGKRGFQFLDEKVDVAAEIGEVRKTLRGDARDAPRYRKLGSLYGELRDEERSREALRQAATLYRQRVQSKPKDGRLHAMLGETLSAIQEVEEAEVVLRRAVQLSPTESTGWAQLAWLLVGRAERTLLGTEVGDIPGTYEGLLHRIIQKPPTPDQAAGAQRYLDEARNCFDQAVAATPREPEIYVQRGLCRSWSGFVQGILQVLREEPKVPLHMRGAESFMNLALSPEALADFQHAARLRPNDYRSIATAALFELITYTTRPRERPAVPSLRPWDALPQKAQSSLRTSLDRLQVLAQRTNKAAAAGAAEALGAFQAALEDRAEAEKNLRRALALDPARDRAWEILTALLLKDHRFEELAELGERRTETYDSVRIRILLAKIDAARNQLDRSEANIRAALKLAPQDVTANVAYAVLLMKREDSPMILREAGDHLLKAVEGSRGQSLTRSQSFDYRLTTAIYLALAGKEQEAVLRLERLLEELPENPEAREALGVLQPRKHPRAAAETRAKDLRKDRPHPYHPPHTRAAA